MKRIFKRTLFIFMSILLTQSCDVQVSAAAPVATGFFRTCGRKVGTSAMTHIFRPAFVLTRGLVVATAGAFGLYTGGELLLEKAALPIAVPAPAAAAPKVTEVIQGFFGELFNNWNLKANAPQVIAPGAGKEVAKKTVCWCSWISSMIRLDYMKNTWLGKLVIAHPKRAKLVLAYTAAGYAYIYIVKRIQLNTIHKKFFIGIDAAQNTRPNDPTWIECQNILRNSGRGYQANPTVQNAFDYINSLSSSDIDNGFVDWAFVAHVLLSRQLRNDKMLWIF